MDASDEAGVPLSVKERARLLDSRVPNRVDLVQRTKSAPVPEESVPPVLERTPTLRPNLTQFGAKSEELLRATKSGVVEIAGKGRTGFLEATGSIKEFIVRPRSSNGGAATSNPEHGTVPFPAFEDEAFDSREIFLLNDSTEDGRENQSSTIGKRGLKWKLPDFDRHVVSPT